VPVAQDGGLGLAGGAAGEEQDRDVGLDIGQVRRRVGIGADGVEPGAGDDLDALHAGDAAGHIVVDNGRRRRRASEQLAKILVGEAVVQWGERATQQAGGEQGDGDGGGIQADVDDVVVRLGRQPGGRGAAARPEVGVGRGGRQRADRRTVGHGVGGHFEEERGVHGRP